jgi:DNA-binding SARP family transcriptional activator
VFGAPHLSKASRCYGPDVAIDYRVLGPLEAFDDGRQLSLGGPKQRAMLASLLLRATEVVPVGRLIDDLWGDDPPESAANIIQGYVSGLRHVIGREAIATRGRGYLLHVEPSNLDLRRFERLVDEGGYALANGRPLEAVEAFSKALSLWRGPPFADISDEPFVVVAAGRLDELRLAALEKRIDADLACGRHGDVAAELATLVEEYPFRERFRAQHMLALYRSERQTDALASYQAARAKLAEELGIDPSPALQSLEKSILDHHSSLDLSVSGGERLPELSEPRRVVLVAVLDGSRLPTMLDLGAALVRDERFELVIARLVRDRGELAAETARLNEGVAVLEQRGVTARAAAFTSQGPGEDLVRLSSEQDVVRDGLPDTDVARVLSHAPCDVALLVGAGGLVAGPVVVPFGGTEHDWAAIELGAWYARARGLPLRLIGADAFPDAGKRDASLLLFHASVAIQRAVGIATDPVLAAPGGEGMVSAASGAGVLVVGLSDRWQREGLGPLRLALVRGAAQPTCVVRRGLRPGGLAPRESLTRFTWSVGPPVS